MPVIIAIPTGHHDSALNKYQWLSELAHEPPPSGELVQEYRRKQGRQAEPRRVSAEQSNAGRRGFAHCRRSMRGQAAVACLTKKAHLVGLLAFKARSGAKLHFALPADWALPGTMVSSLLGPIAASTQRRAFWEAPRASQPSFLGHAMLEAASQR